MKNVQVIDSAMNCTFPVFQFEDVQFAMLFPQFGQDIAFIDDVHGRLSTAEVAAAFDGVWDRPIAKTDVVGLHGTLFYGFDDRKNCFPVSRRECDWHNDAMNAAQRLMNESIRAAKVE